jgi:hypothetical protein
VTTFVIAAILWALAPSAQAQCAGKVSRAWGKFTIEAMADGPTCDHAVAVIVIRNAKHDVVYSLAGAAEHNAVFLNNESGKIKQALTDWISARGERRMSELPNWKQGADSPAQEPPAEFPFVVSGEIGRNDYLALRKAGAPLFCFVQGMESERCVAATKDGDIRDVGVQLFPG